jgi:hypothetical protein
MAPLAQRLRYPKAGQGRLLAVTTLAVLSFGLDLRYGARIGGMGFPGVAD